MENALGRLVAASRGLPIPKILPDPEKLVFGILVPVLSQNGGISKVCLSFFPVAGRQFAYAPIAFVMEDTALGE